MAMFGTGDNAMTILIRAKNETEKVFKKMKEDLNTFKGDVKKMQPTFKKMAVIGTAAFGAVAIGAKKAVDEARDFEEETNKFNVVFKDVSKEAEKMANNLNKNYRLSRLESKKLLSATGDILTGFGFTGDAALDLSGKVNTLAVDLASFTNAQGGAEAVSSALTKALLGERESLKTYGIAIMEADVQTELLATGMSELTGEALRQAKAQATFNLILRQSKNAIGDTARSSDSLKAAQDQLRATTADLSLAIGQTLTPILNDILQELLPVITKIKEWVEENPKLTKVIIITTAAMAGLLAVVGLIGVALPAIITGFTLLLGPIGIVIGAVGLLSIAGIKLVKNWNKIKNTFIDILYNLDTVMVSFVKGQIFNFKVLAKNLWKIFLAISEGLKGNFAKAAIGLKNIMGGIVLDTLNKAEILKSDLEEWENEVVNDIDKMGKEMGGKVEEGAGLVEKALEDMANTGGKSLEDLKEATEKETEEIIKSINKISDTFEDLKSSFKKLQDFDEEGNKKRLEFHEAYAEAFVDQEEKVADLRKKMSGETDHVKRTTLEQELKREEEALRKKKSIEIEYQDLIENIRKNRLLTDFERTVSDIQSRHELFQAEAEKKRKLILEELEMNKKKFSDLINLEKGFALEAFDITKKLTDDKIAQYNREIEKLNELKRAMAEANRVQSLGSLAIIERQAGEKNISAPTIPVTKSGNNNNVYVNFNNPVVKSSDDIKTIKQQMDKYFRPLATNNKLSF